MRTGSTCGTSRRASSFRPCRWPRSRSHPVRRFRRTSGGWALADSSSRLLDLGPEHVGLAGGVESAEQLQPARLHFGRRLVARRQPHPGRQGLADRFLRCWDADSGKLLWDSSAESEDPYVALFGPDGREVFTQEHRKGFRVLVRDAATGKLTGTPRSLPAGADCLMGFSRDGRCLALQTTEEGVVLWEPATGKVRFRLPRPGVSPGQRRTRHRR